MLLRTKINNVELSLDSFIPSVQKITVRADHVIHTQARQRPGSSHYKGSLYLINMFALFACFFKQKNI